MFRHLKCHPQGAHCVLLKLHTDFLVLVKLLKYKMINFAKTRKTVRNFSKAQRAL